MPIKEVAPKEARVGSSRWPEGTSLNPDDVVSMLSAAETVQVSLSSAQILALSATPVTLVPAQGANKIIIVDEILFRMSRTATAYASGGALEFRYTNGSGAKVAADIAATVVTTGGAGVEYNNVGGVVTSLTPVANAAIVITNATGAFTTGTGTAKVFIKYRVLDVSTPDTPS